MAANKYIALVAGKFQEVFGLVTSAGVGDANKIVALDSTGHLDLTVLPVGVGPDTQSIVTSENLAAGDLVNVYNNAGVLNARKADATADKEANGFVIASSTTPAANTVYFNGLDAFQTGFTPGDRLFLSATTPGKASATPATGTGQYSQQVGFAVGATSFQFDPQERVLVG